MARVAITGMGVITPLGNTVREYWSNLKNAVVGIDFIRKIDTTDLPVKIAAEVKDFQIEDYMNKKELKRNDMYTIYALAACKEAVEQSDIENAYADKRDRLGVIVSTGIGGLSTMEEQIIRMSQKGPGRVSPFFIPTVIANMAAGAIAIKYGARGACMSVITACSSSSNAIGEAYRSIKHGYLDACIAGGSEASITKIGIAGFAALTALSTSNEPLRSSIPFDKEREGFVMGEGAGIIVLENMEIAVKRGAEILGEIAGYGTTCDAYHVTSPIPDGSGAAAAMNMAINDAGICTEDITYINAHGTGTQANDSAETAAIKSVFGDYAYRIPISSTKSMTGHLLGAAGAVEAIACVESAREGFIHPTAGYKISDPLCDLDYVPNTGRVSKTVYSLSNSLGFGGHNSVLCIKA